MLTPLKQMTAEDLRKNILSTYWTLRMGIVVLSAALPVSLYAYSWYADHGLAEHSMSAFYGAHDGAMRNWFVGVLCAIGAFLILYRGFSTAENWLLNLAGGFSGPTAETPGNCWCDLVGGAKKPPLIVSGSFFSFMAAGVLFFARETGTPVPHT